MKAQEAVCVAILAAISLFYLVTIRSGQPWPDDFAMYVREAKSLAEHTPLRDTGYIYDPYNAALGPRLYPPVFPLLLTPGYLIGGLRNLVPMQIEIVLFFTGMLIVLWRGLGLGLPPAERAAMLGIVGLNPVLWDARDLIVSDIPFTFFLYLTFYFAEDLRKDQISRGVRLWKAVLVAALVYLCYGTRTIGVVLIPALLICGAINWRQKGGQSLIWAGLISIIPCLAQSKWLAGDGYGDYLGLGLLGLIRTFGRNLRTYSWSFALFWQDPYSKLLRDFLFVGFAFFILLAYFHRVRRGPRTYEIAAPLYLGVILVFPYDGGARYLIPIFPLLVCYALEGIGLLRSRWTRVRWEPVLVSLLVLVFLSYGAEFWQSSFGPFSEGVNTRQSKELFAFIQDHTKPGDVLVFRRPRALALFTGRNAAVYPSPDNRDKYAPYLQTIDASYLIEAPSLDDAPFDTFLAGNCLAKQLVFENADFQVFHVRAADIQACADKQVPTHSLSAQVR